MQPLRLDVAISDPYLSAYSLSPLSPPLSTSSHNQHKPLGSATANTPGRQRQSLRFSPSVKAMDTEAGGEFEHPNVASESDPLIASETGSKKPFYRARPLW